MGTIKYSGPVASFHCPTNAEIHSLKVHFSPKQLGSGDPSPENVREIVGWDGVAVHDYTSDKINTLSIPSDYKKVEYLESTGIQYIKTDVFGRSGISAKYTIMFTEDNLIQQVCAEKVNDTSSLTVYFPYVIENNSWRMQIADLATESTVKMVKNTCYNVECIMDSMDQRVYVNNQLICSGTYEAQFNSENKLYLFASNNANGGIYLRCAHMKMYRFEVSDTTTKVLLANYIPCFRKSDNKPGMYDTVSQTFYTNAGTGEFLYGPEVSGYTTDYEFGVLGKNKLNAYGEQQPPNDTTSAPTTKRTFISDSYCVGMSWSNYYYPVQVTSYSVLNGTVTVSNVNVYGIGFPVKVFAGQAYCLSSTTTSNGRAHVAYFASDGTYISGVQTDIMNKSFVVPSNVSVAVIVLYSSEGEATFSDIQLELGSTATTYEPYDPKHTVYGGWVDLISGEVCEEYDIKQLTSADYIFNVYTYENTNGISIANVLDNTAQRVPGYCTHTPIMYKTSSGAWNASGSHTYMWLGVGNKYAYWVGILDDLQLSTADEFKNWLDTQNVYIVWKLVTPITHHLSPTQLQTFLGHNNVWSNADYVEVEYDLHETQDILARKNFIIANQPHIETASGDIVSFNTDMSAPLKECKIHFSPVQDLHGYDSPWPAGGGKNLLDMASENIVIRKYINNTGVVTSNNNNFYNSKYIPVKANTAYTLSVNKAISYCSFMEYDANKDFIQRTLFGASTPAITSETITTTANTAYVLIGSNVKYATINVNDVQAISWQFEEGSSATSYVPYENICPIGGWTGCEVTKTGKNLLSAFEIGKNVNWTTGEIETDSTNRTAIIKCRVDFNAYQYYTITGISEFSVTPFAYDANNEYIGRAYADQVSTRTFSSTGFTLSQTGNTNPIAFVIIQAFSSASGTTADINNKNIQLELGSTATTYELYTGTTLPIDWTTEAGTVYGGYVDLISGKLTQTYKSVNLGDYDWNLTSSDEGTIFMTDVFIDDIAFGTGQFFCSYYKALWGNVAPKNDNTINAFARSQNRGDRILLRDDTKVNFTSEQFKESMNGIQFIYPTKTPIEYQLSPQTLRTLRGQNNIWSTANGNIEIQYWRR